MVGGKTTEGLGDRSPPAGSRGRAPVGSLGMKSPRSWRICEVVTSKFYAILVVFHTFSPTCAYVFFLLAGIVPLSLQNGGAFYTLLPLVCKWGEQLPPGSATYEPMYSLSRFKSNHFCK